MSSARLPGKVLMPLAGKPNLERLVGRLRRSHSIDDIVVATTENQADDVIAEFCKKIACRYFRGSEDDVLGRVLQAAEHHDADLIVEITGDCPMIDHRHVDKTIELFYSGDYDHASNILEHSLPIGFDVQIFPLSVLKRIDRLTDDPIDRAHVSYYIYSHPEQFRLVGWRAEGDLNWPELALTLDEPEDYELLNKIYEELLPEKEDFSAEDIVMLMKHRPDLRNINTHIRRKTVQEG